MDATPYKIVNQSMTILLFQKEARALVQLTGQFCIWRSRPRKSGAASNKYICLQQGNNAGSFNVLVLQRLGLFVYPAVFRGFVCIFGRLPSRVCNNWTYGQ